MAEINGELEERAYEEFPVAFLTLDIKCGCLPWGLVTIDFFVLTGVSPLKSYLHDVRQHSEKNV